MLRLKGATLATMVAVLPSRLQQAIRIISMSGDPRAEDAQTAVTLVMGRLVQLEEALNRVLDDEPDAREHARRALVQGGWWRPPE